MTFTRSPISSSKCIEFSAESPSTMFTGVLPVPFSPRYALILTRSPAGKGTGREKRDAIYFLRPVSVFHADTRIWKEKEERRKGRKRERERERRGTEFASRGNISCKRDEEGRGSMSVPLSSSHLKFWKVSVPRQKKKRACRCDVPSLV